MSLKLKKLTGGLFELKKLKSKSFSKEELLAKLNEEESQYYVLAEGDGIKVESFDLTAAYVESEVFKLSDVYSETKVIENNRIELYNFRLNASLSMGLEDLASTLEGYSNKIEGKIAVSFSGGLDSSLLAWIFRESSPLLITIGLRDSEDIRASKESSKELGLEHFVYEVSEKEIKQAVSSVCAAASTPMDISLASGFYIVSKVAKEQGAEVLLIGQLADELYGGYKKYESVPLDKLNGVLYEDLKKAILALRRDSKIVLSNGVLPVFPYGFKTFLLGSLSLPPHLKVQKAGLRKIGEILGLPKKIIASKKKAFQYGSKIDKAVRKILSESCKV